MAEGKLTIPLKESTAPRSRHRRASSGPPLKQWKTVRVGHPLGREDVEGLGPGLPGVDHEGQVVLVGQRDLGGEHLRLLVAGRVVVVEVEPALPHRHHLGLAQERLEPVDAVLGVVRVHAGRGPHPPRVPAGDLDVVGGLARRRTRP